MIGELFPKYESSTKRTCPLPNNSNITAATGRDAFFIRNHTIPTPTVCDSVPSIVEVSMSYQPVHMTCLRQRGITIILLVYYYVVPISPACTAIYLGGNVALHSLIAHCTLINFKKCGLHFFYLDNFL